MLGAGGAGGGRGPGPLPLLGHRAGSRCTWDTDSQPAAASRAQPCHPRMSVHRCSRTSCGLSHPLWQHKDILQGGSRGGRRWGERRNWIRSGVPEQNLLSPRRPRKPLSPQIPASHPRRQEGRTGRLHLEVSDGPIWGWSFSP